MWWRRTQRPSNSKGYFTCARSDTSLTCRTVACRTSWGIEGLGSPEVLVELLLRHRDRRVPRRAPRVAENDLAVGGEAAHVVRVVGAVGVAPLLGVVLVQLLVVRGGDGDDLSRVEGLLQALQVLVVVLTDAEETAGFEVVALLARQVRRGLLGVVALDSAVAALPVAVVGVDHREGLLVVRRPGLAVAVRGDGGAVAVARQIGGHGDPLVVAVLVPDADADRAVRVLLDAFLDELGVLLRQSGQRGDVPAVAELALVDVVGRDAVHEQRVGRCLPVDAVVG